MDKFKPLPPLDLPNDAELERAFGDIVEGSESLAMGEVSRDLVFDTARDGDTTVVMDEAASERDDWAGKESEGDPAFSFQSLRHTLAGDTNLKLSSFVSEIDEFHPDYEKLFAEAESVIDKLSAKDLLELAGGNKKDAKLSGSEGLINSAVLLKLMQRYVEKKQYKNNKNFFKIVEVLRATHKLPSYSLGEKVSVLKESPRSYYVFKKIKYILNVKSPEEITQMVKKGNLHTLALKEVCEMYSNNRNTDVSLKNKIQTILQEQEVYDLFYEVEDLIDQSKDKDLSLIPVFKENGISSDTLATLLGEYDSGRKSERGEFNNYKKIIDDILKDPASVGLWLK